VVTEAAQRAKRRRGGALRQPGRQVLLFSSVLSFLGCSPAGLQAAAAVLQGAAATPTQSQERLLFGGDGHKTFLGCLNCSQFDASSVLNSYGAYGSRYSSSSIFNPYSDYGSLYSTYSACNPYASDPPVIVDRNGNFYGRLTLNRYRGDLGVGASLGAWLAAVCHH